LQQTKPIINETLGTFKATIANDALSALTNCNARIALQLSAEQRLKLEQLEKEQQNFIRWKFGASLPASRKEP